MLTIRKVLKWIKPLAEVLTPSQVQSGFDCLEGMT